MRRRIDELGTKEPSIEQQGEDRIVVQVPGLSDPTQLIDILKTTAKMTFQLVDEIGRYRPSDERQCPDRRRAATTSTAGPKVVRRPIWSSRSACWSAGDRLKTAGWTNNQQTGKVVVTFRFDNVGAREFGDVTKENVGHRFAIVLDKKIITAPRIDEPILGGSGEIEGNFTVQSANNLAVLLRAGALPAPLKPIEMRTVGAELGADSVKAGRYAAIGGLLLVGLFMILRYGLFGVFADVAMTLNVILLIAVLTLFGATLTLPGIAGIVLTMGMAVDANVLIYERIREEQRNGRSMLGSIDTGLQTGHGDDHRRQRHPFDRLADSVRAGLGPGARLRRHAGRRHYHVLLHGGDGDAPDRGGMAEYPPAEKACDLSQIGPKKRTSKSPSNGISTPLGGYCYGRASFPICATR